jgi:trans-2,3-dihydro-3-hydroxyanthranilate isomerase
MPRHCYVLRVFTKGDEGGNYLGVVTDILGLDDERMQRIATELGFPETIYLNWFDGPRPRARIFTPSTELPFAGHPLVGAAWVLINLGPLDPGGIECPIGIIPIRQRGPDTWIEVPPDQPVVAGERELPASVVAVETVEVRVPSPYLLVRLRDPRAVAEVSPSDFGDLGAVYVWAWLNEGEMVKARFFAPGFGIVEDPATGSAAVALAARMRAVGDSEGRLEIHQGAETGQPSLLRLEWDRSRTAVGGTVVRDEVRFLKL